MQPLSLQGAHPSPSCRAAFGLWLNAVRDQRHTHSRLAGALLARTEPITSPGWEETAGFQQGRYLA